MAPFVVPFEETFGARFALKLAVLEPNGTRRATMARNPETAETMAGPRNEIAFNGRGQNRRICPNPSTPSTYLIGVGRALSAHGRENLTDFRNASRPATY